MTTRELSALLGTEVTYEPIDGLRFRCLVTDAKSSYGTPKVQIEPLSGDGRAWVNRKSVRTTSVAPLDTANQEST